MAAVLVVFSVSRIVAVAVGVTFDTTPLAGFWQIADPSLLKSHLAQTIWYLHSQPPLFNLLLGLGLKMSGGAFATVAHGAYIALGVVIALSLYALLGAAGVGRWISAAAAALFTASPAAIVFENWLFYEYLVAALLVLAAVLFVAFERRPSTIRSLALFSALGAVCLIRASFQIVVLLFVLGFLLRVFSEARRAIVLGALVPILLVAGLSVKNWVLFGTPSTSSWAGMNLMQIDQFAVRGDELTGLQRRGIVSPIATIPVFQPLDAYKGVVPVRTWQPLVPVLDDRTKPSSGVPNFNNIQYVSVSNRYLHDFYAVLLHRPAIYLRGVWIGIKKAATPASDYYFFVGNRGKIEPYARGYDALVLWQPHMYWANGRPEGAAWGIVLGYLAALAFGAVEFVRAVRRRRASLLLAFVWLLLAYATAAMTFGEVAENQRVRFVGDPLATSIVVVGLVRGLAWAKQGWLARTSGDALRVRITTPRVLAAVAGACAAAAVIAMVADRSGRSSCTVPPPTPGLTVEFGHFSTGAAAQSALARARAVGFVQTQVEQFGCSDFRVVETGIPSRRVGASIVAEAKGANLVTQVVDEP